jgi:hypothetical protein
MAAAIIIESLAAYWWINSGRAITGPSWLMPPLFFLPIYLGIAWFSISMHRLKRRVRAADGCLCPNCLYDLAACPDVDKCPECAFAGGPNEARESWRAAGLVKR